MCIGIVIIEKSVIFVVNSSLRVSKPVTPSSLLPGFGGGVILYCPPPLLLHILTYIFCICLFIDVPLLGEEL